VPRLDYSALRDIGQEAESLLGHKVFGLGVASLKQSYMDQLASFPAGDDRVAAVHTKLRLVDEIVGELKAMASAVRIERRKQDAEANL
jgi:hypothetical protein